MLITKNSYQPNLRIANQLFAECQLIENSFTAIVSNAVALDTYFQSSKIDFQATVIYQETISDYEITLANNEKNNSQRELCSKPSHANCNRLLHKSSQ